MVASQPDVVCYAVLRGVGDPTVLEGYEGAAGRKQFSCNKCEVSRFNRSVSRARADEDLLGSDMEHLIVAKATYHVFSLHTRPASALFEQCLILLLCLHEGVFEKVGICKV